MSEARPPLAPSLSFSGTSSTSALSRPLKRRLTSSQELDFFTPASTSFKPRPYTPTSLSPCEPQAKPPNASRGHIRSVEALALPPPGMDPSPLDPNVVFIHPPFNSFPNSYHYPDGLSYPLMAENPEWFLDATDFISTTSSNPNAIAYPPHLEPPRGWCPAKKKDLKERGSDGWPEGEEPRLRCTFCRRTYAGVNAKSMWRRHVYEKHKIAMSNRRDGNERPRGRGSNKENRQLVSGRERDDSHDSLVKMNVTPQIHPDPRNISHKSRFRSLLPAEEVHHHLGRSNANDDVPVPSAPLIPQKEFSSSSADSSVSRPHPLSQSTLPPMSPPLTPQSPSVSDTDGSFQTSTGIFATSPPPCHPIIPPSPYDPLQTPSFRHSPPRLPSDQPWRFPSPSHPLHSRARELCLSMLARDVNSPAIKIVSPAIDVSPAGAAHGTPLRSPRIIAVSQDKTSGFDLGTPESMTRLPRPSPRTLFSKGHLPLPSTDRLRPERIRHRIEESPLSRNSRRVYGRRRTPSEASNDWLSNSPLPPAAALSSNALLTDHDPFVDLYNSWSEIHSNGNENPQERCTPPMSSPEAESPVLRSGALPAGVDLNGKALVGLGIGLLEPFTLSGDETQPVEDDSKFGGVLIYPPLTEEEGDEAEVEGVLGVSGTETTPPLKRRRTTVNRS